MWMIGFVNKSDEENLKTRGFELRRVDPKGMQIALGLGVAKDFAPSRGNQMVAVWAEGELFDRLRGESRQMSRSSEEDRKLMEKRKNAAQRLFNGAGPRMLGVQRLDYINRSDDWCPDGDSLGKTFYWKKKDRKNGLDIASKSTFVVVFAPGKIDIVTSVCMLADPKE
jgi:hypothetical protein